MILKTYSQAAREASSNIAKNPLAILGVFGLQIAFALVSILTTPLGSLVGGMIRSLIFLVLLTIGYGVCENMHQGRGKIRFDDFKEIDWTLFSALINVGFILWMTSFLLQAILPPAGSQWMLAAFNILALFVLNPAPEVAILKRLDSMAAVTYCFEFMKHKTLEWILPSIILLLPTFYYGGSITFFIRTAGADVLLPVSLLLSGFLDLLLPVLSHFQLPDIGAKLIVVGLNSVLGLWLVLFRLSLFERLERR